MKITMIYDDVENGHVSIFDCPIALALQRVFKNNKITVGLFNINFGYGLQPFALPQNALNFRKEFDTGSKPQPIEFEISDEFAELLKK